jgi:hypothetical protein
MSRADKIRALQEAFKNLKPIKLQGHKLIFRELRNGKPIEGGMNDHEFDNYVEDLKRQYESVVVWVEDKTYDDNLILSIKA